MLNMSEILLPLIAVLLVVGPFAFILRHGVSTKNAKTRIMTQVCVFVGVFLTILLFNAQSFSALAEEAGSTGLSSAAGLGFIAAGLAVGIGSLGAGWAVSSAASAAIGAVSENSENFGKAMIFVALGEGVAIYGLLIAILIINKL